jgi:hypothetical protein
MSNPLDTVIDAYKVVLDGLDVTARVLDKSIRNAILTSHTFYGEPTSENMDRIDAARRQVADLVVLSLVSTFERTIRDRFASMRRISAPASDDVDEKVQRQILADMEYWKLSDEILAIFSGRVDRDVIGQVKQAIDYRNWVAHGRSGVRPPKSNVVPQFAYRILTEFLSQAGLLTSMRSGEMTWNEESNG